MVRCCAVLQMCAAGLQQAVQALLSALLLVSTSGRAVFVVVLLQDGDHVVVAKVHRFLHRRVPPSVQKKNKTKHWYVKKPWVENMAGTVHIIACYNSKQFTVSILATKCICFLL